MAALVKFVLSPFITGPLLYALTLGPPNVREPLLQQLTERLGDKTELAITALKVLVGLGVVSKINETLSGWAERNWVWRNDMSRWVWGQEVAVITGGSMGIGAEIAKRLAMRGVKVAVLDIAPLSEQITETKASHNITYFECDIADSDAVTEAAYKIRGIYGDPTILINNAGVGNAGDMISIDPKRLKTVFDINIISHWYTIREFLPAMLKNRKGYVMSVSSMGAFVGVGGIVDYSCVKAGLIALHEGLNQELKWRYKVPEIKTCIVHPLWTKTRLISAMEDDFKKARTPVLSLDSVAERMTRQILEGRTGQLFLPEAAWTRRAAGLRGLPSWIQELIRDSQAKTIQVKGSSIGIDPQIMNE